MASLLERFVKLLALGMMAVLPGLMTACAHTPRQSFTELVTEDFSVPAVDAGVQLHVRNKRPAALARFAPDNVVLFVHGATGSPETGFDLALDGLSWMDWMARQGNDVYFVSVRGYGGSTRPREMNEPPQDNPPVVRTGDAARDVGAAVEFIRKRRGVRKVTLIGHSWGSTIMPFYTAQNNDKVERLALFAPGWLRTQGASPTDGGGQLGAYRIVTEEGVRRRRGSGLPPGKQEELMPARWLDAYFEAAFASDPWSATQQPRAFRAPNGVVQDSREFTNVGKPLYNPAEIRVPTLLILAEWDADTPLYMARALFPLLVNVPSKRLVVIGEGTHVVQGEKNRMQLFREVQLFFAEGRR